MKIGLAFRAFFAALFNSEKADQIDAAMSGKFSPTGKAGSATGIPTAKDTTQVQNVAPKKMEIASGRSDALTLLSVLQREARFIDLVQESLDGYSDAQVGAAARDVLKQSKKSLQRMFDIQPLSDASEGATISLPTNASPTRWKINGSSDRSNMVIVHPGWVAKAAQVPVWTGENEDKLVIAPIEVE